MFSLEIWICSFVIAASEAVLSMTVKVSLSSIKHFFDLAINILSSSFLRAMTYRHSSSVATLLLYCRYSSTSRVSITDLSRWVQGSLWGKPTPEEYWPTKNTLWQFSLEKYSELSASDSSSSSSMTTTMLSYWIYSVWLYIEALWPASISLSKKL